LSEALSEAEAEVEVEVEALPAECCAAIGRGGVEN
jgi:hypothetical protein